MSQHHGNVPTRLPLRLRVSGGDQLQPQTGLKLKMILILVSEIPQVVEA